MPARGNARARATFRQPLGAYTPYGLHDWPLSELRKEYTRLRDIAQKRIKRLAQDPQSMTSDIYREHRHGFPTIKSMQGSRDALERAMADVALFVRDPTSTVGGLRERNLQRAGAVGVDTGGWSAGDYMSLGDWWAYVDSHKLDGIAGSDELIQYYYDRGGRGLSREDFEAWRIQEDNYVGYQPEEGSSSSVFGAFGRFLGF